MKNWHLLGQRDTFPKQNSFYSSNSSLDQQHWIQNSNLDEVDFEVDFDTNDHCQAQLIENELYSFYLLSMASFEMQKLKQSWISNSDLDSSIMSSYQAIPSFLSQRKETDLNPSRVASIC